MSSPTVSVLMSVYNNAASVDASIRSIVEQTYADWEMVLVNDASTDGSLDKLLYWQDRDSRIKVYSNECNLGLAASLNKALNKSAGAYIARMDGDDVAMPDRLMQQVAFLDANPQTAIVSSACILFDETGAWGVRNGKPNPTKHDFLWGSQFLHPATMMRREALLHAGGYRVCRDTLRTEDYDLFMRMYALGYSGFNISEPLLRYYERRKPRRVKFSLRWSEAKTRYRGFKELGLLPGGLLYVVKPLLVGIVPGGLKRKLQDRRSAAEGGGGA
ncbi:MAG: glycosyltransferase [Bacillota bacterium]